MNPQISQVDRLHRTSWYSPAQCLSYYKVPYQFREIQIHWWDDPAKKPTHDGIVNYIKNKTGSSVNYVASAGRVTKMVPEENCAITTHSGNPYGIKIECSPYGTDADYQTIAWLIADIWKRRGKLPLKPHRLYWNTTCPGTLDLARMDKEATLILEGEDMKATANDLKYLYLGVYAQDTPDDVLAKDPFIGTDLGAATMKVLDYANTKGVAYWQYKASAEEQIANLKKRVAELEAAGEYVETKVYVKKKG